MKKLLAGLGPLKFFETPHAKWCFNLMRLVQKMISEDAYISRELGEMNDGIIFDLVE